MTENESYESDARLTKGRAFFKRQLSLLPDARAHLIFWPLMVGGVVLDIWSKKAVFAWMKEEPDFRYVIIDGFLQFVMALNDGAAWGMFSGRRFMLILVSAIALIAGIVIFLSSGKELRIFHAGLAIFTAGVCGNLYDRIFNDGMVRDFIDVYYRGHHWPAFNVGDSMLCIGVGLMIISVFSSAKKTN